MKIRFLLCLAVLLSAACAKKSKDSSSDRSNPPAGAEGDVTIVGDDRLVLKVPAGALPPAAQLEVKVAPIGSGDAKVTTATISLVGVPDGAKVAAGAVAAFTVSALGDYVLTMRDAAGAVHTFEATALPEAGGMIVRYSLPAFVPPATLEARPKELAAPTTPTAGPSAAPAPTPTPAPTPAPAPIAPDAPGLFLQAGKAAIGVGTSATVQDVIVLRKALTAPDIAPDATKSYAVGDDVGGAVVVATRAGFVLDGGLPNNLQQHYAAYARRDGLSSPAARSDARPSAVEPVKAFARIAVGDETACGVTLDGYGYCWGDGTFFGLGNGSQTNVVKPVAVDVSTLGDVGFYDIAAGYRRACAVAADGGIRCWGADGGSLGYGTTGGHIEKPRAAAVGTTLTFVNVVMARDATCGTTAAGTGYCWGTDDGQRLGNGSASNVTVPTALDLSSILTPPSVARVMPGSDHGCTLTAAGRAYCYSSNGSHGVSGDGLELPYDAPTSAATSVDAPLVALATNRSENACSVSGGGRVYCWGRGNELALGNGSSDLEPSPAEADLQNVPQPRLASDVAMGRFFGCLTASSSRRAYCWGENLDGQTGTGAGPDVALPKPIAQERFATLALGASTSCGVTLAGAPFCWGANANGHLGNGAASGSVASPSAVDLTNVLPTTRVRSISLGTAHSCLLTSTGFVHCWGDNAHGQLGWASGVEAVGTPTRSAWTLPAGEDALTLRAGGDHVCAESTAAATSRFQCWGRVPTASGPVARSAPAAIDVTSVADGAGFRAWSGATTHAVGIGADGKLYAFGSGSGASTLPTAVTTTPGSLRFGRAVCSGDNHSCALGADGKVYCWGGNDSGQLGLGDLTARAAPTAVDLSDVISDGVAKDVTCGAAFTCALLANGTAACWGKNLSGQTGSTASTTVPLPSAVSTTGALGAVRLRKLSAGADFVVAVLDDGRVASWGSDADGALGDGDGTSTPLHLPRLATYARRAVDVAAGARHACLVDDRGRVRCWGANARGQVGAGSAAATIHVPTAINEDLIR